MITTHSAGGILLNPFAEIAVVNQKGRSWSLPKGHLNQEEDCLTAAFREIQEETGIHQLTYLQHLGHYSRFKIGLNGEDDTTEKKIIHFYLFKTQCMQLSPEDPDNPEAKWVHSDQVSSMLTHPKDQAFFQSQIGIINQLKRQLISISTTTSSKDDAYTLSSALIQQKRVACAQIDGPISSIYTWKNNTQQDEEYRLTLKTTWEHYKTVSEFISDTHPYECPQILCSHLESTHTDYEKWILNQLNN